MLIALPVSIFFAALCVVIVLCTLKWIFISVTKCISKCKENCSSSSDGYVVLQENEYAYDSQEDKRQTGNISKPVERFNRYLEVQVYVPQKAEISFHNELIKAVEQACDLKIHFNIKDSVDDINRDEPLFVICTHAFRLGTDAMQTINGIPAPTPTVLLVVHCKDVHNLPSAQCSLVLKGPEFTQLYGMCTDCHKERGIYPCNMNSTATENIVRFICSYNENRIGISQ